MTAQQTILACLLAATLMSVAASVGQSREPRRAPPSGHDSVTLTDLEFSCSVQGWALCHQMTSNLLNSTHPLNGAISECINSNSPFGPRPTEQPPSRLNHTIIGFMETERNATTSEITSGSGELSRNSTANSSAEMAQETSANEQRCLVTGEDKKRIRREVYCKLLFDLDQTVRSVVQYLCLWRDFNCIPHYSDPGYLTPPQILTSIRFWHEDMINTHKRCCESQDDAHSGGRRFSRDLEDHYGNKVDFRIGEAAPTCPISNARILWDSGLAQVAVLVHVLELMQGLGRRRTCLRGCVSENQVICTNLLLPYVLLSYPSL